MNPEINENERIGHLIVKFLSDNITDDELVELSGWINHSEENKRIFEQFKAGKIIKHPGDETNKAAQHSPVKNKQFALPITIAVLIIIGSIFIVYRSANIKITPTQNADFRSSAIPTGITLTLSDGKQLNIDSSDAYIQQNYAVIKKYGNNITYIPTRISPGKPEYNVVQTPFTRQTLIVLTDKSRIWLNACSSIRYPTTFDNKARKVEITGEAYFEISPMIDSTLSNSKIPFIVSVNGLDVIVKGTKFNLQAYNNENEIKTTLLEGSVEIKKGNQSIVLQPGQQAVYTNGSFNVTKTYDEEEVLAWKNNLFVFQNLEIKNVMHQLSRWYNITVVYEDLILEPFTATVPRTISLENLLNILELSNKNVHFRIENKNTVIVSK